MDGVEMSLINRMLQDLEARRPEGGDDKPAIAQVRAVRARNERHAGRWIGAAVLTLAVLGACAWWWMRLAGAKVSVVPPVPVVAAVPPPGAGAPTVSAPLGAAAPSGNPLPTYALKLEAALSKVPPAAPEIAIMPPEAARRSPSSPAPESKTTVAVVPKPAPTVEVVANAAPQAAPADAPTLVAAPDSPNPGAAARRGAVVPQPQREAPRARGVAEPAASVAISKQVQELTPAQRAESEYRKAGVQVQQGRSAEAIDALEHAIQFDPQHKQARQMLAALLLQQNRRDDAIRTLRDGLRLEPNQPVPAMTLARLLVDKGDTAGGIEVLRGAQAAGDERADFLAFLAALLQRSSSHAQAVEHYQAALRKAPQNGVWWMGLGISLQAENRLAEARDAFGRAKASASLSPELQAFVEQKLKQVQR
jgi:MSHA biogenesis protein MshN